MPPPALLKQVEHLQGTWPISHPSRWLGKRALLDTAWQVKTRQQLIPQSQQLQQQLQQHLCHPIPCTHLFCYLTLPNAASLQLKLAQKGIWLRYFAQPQALRIGLPQTPQQLAALIHLLEGVQNLIHNRIVVVQ